jgi:hypothetical protein
MGMSDMDRKIKPRDPRSYPLPTQGKTAAWFYANKGSIDLVVQTSADTIGYRFRLRDMRKIVEALS